MASIFTDPSRRELDELRAKLIDQNLLGLAQSELNKVVRGNPYLDAELIERIKINIAKRLLSEVF